MTIDRLWLIAPVIMHICFLCLVGRIHCILLVRAYRYGAAVGQAGEAGAGNCHLFRKRKPGSR